MDKKERLAKFKCQLDTEIKILKATNEITKELIKLSKNKLGYEMYAKEYGVSTETIARYYKKYKNLPNFSNVDEKKKNKYLLRLMEREMKLRRLKRKSSFFGRLFKLK